MYHLDRSQLGLLVRIDQGEIFRRLDPPTTDHRVTDDLRVTGVDTLRKRGLAEPAADIVRTPNGPARRWRTTAAGRQYVEGYLDTLRPTPDLSRLRDAVAGTAPLLPADSVERLAHALHALPGSGSALRMRVLQLSWNAACVPAATAGWNAAVTAIADRAQWHLATVGNDANAGTLRAIADAATSPPAPAYLTPPPDLAAVKASETVLLQAARLGADHPQLVAGLATGLTHGWRAGCRAGADYAADAIVTRTAEGRRAWLLAPQRWDPPVYQWAREAADAAAGDLPASTMPTRTPLVAAATHGGALQVARTPDPPVSPALIAEVRHAVTALQESIQPVYPARVRAALSRPGPVRAGRSLPSPPRPPRPDPTPPRQGR